MFEYLYELLRNISYYLVLVTMVTYVLPSNSYRKYIRLFTGLVLILMLLTPIWNLFRMKVFITEDLYKGLEGYEWMEEIDENRDEIIESDTFHIEVEDIVVGP